jgi:hypothetical protein
MHTALITAVAPALLALLQVHFREAGLAPETLDFVVQGLANWTLPTLRKRLSAGLFNFTTETKIRKRAAKGGQLALAPGLFFGHPGAFGLFDTGCSSFSVDLTPTRTAHAAAIVGNQLADGKTLRHLRAVLEPDGSFVIWGSFGDDAESVVDMPPALPAPEADDDDDSLSSDDDCDTD